MAEWWFAVFVTQHFSPWLDIMLSRGHPWRIRLIWWMTLCVIHHINWPFWPVDIGCAVLPAWISCPLPAAFSGSPTWGSSPGIPCRRSCGFQGPTGKTATKKPSQNRPALPSLFLEGHASRLCNGWKPRCSAPQGLNEYVKICYIQLLR